MKQPFQTTVAPVWTSSLSQNNSSSSNNKKQFH